MQSGVIVVWDAQGVLPAYISTSCCICLKNKHTKHTMKSKNKKGARGFQNSTAS